MIRLTHLTVLLLLAGCPVPCQAAATAASGQLSRPCATVSGEHITGRDLAVAAPEFNTLPPDLDLGFAPTPGVERIFLVSELKKLAQRYAVEATVNAPICFGWPLHPLSREEILPALEKAFTGRKVDLEVIDQCHAPVPAGELVFPLQSLSGDSKHAALWSGYVSYVTGRKFSTWVQVRVTLHEDQLVAARSIRAGELIAATDLKPVAYAGPLRHNAIIHRPQDAIGKCASRPIAAGVVLEEAMLSKPNDVDREQLVAVHITFGASHIETQGVAVDPGVCGDVIKVRNPKTGRIFRAQISDRGVVTVVPGGDVGLVVEVKKS